MNYIQRIMNSLSERLPGCDTDLLRFYALLVLVTGEEASLEDVHDAWAAWRIATRPDHPSLVWFAALTPQVQELDRKYMNAIRDTAKEVKTWTW